MNNKDTFIKISRKYFESPFWILRDNQQRTKAEAYIDLFNMATVKKNKYTTSDFRTTIDLTRGEGVWSLRFLARRWNWSKGKTETFLKNLKTRQKARQYLRQGIMVTFLIDYSISQDKLVPIEKVKKDGVEDELRTGSGQAQDEYKNDKNDKKEKNNKAPSRVFVKPSVDEVTKYCLERKNGISGQAFCDFYESKGWLIGKNSMKSWPAAVRTWENQRKADNSKSKELPEWMK